MLSFSSNSNFPRIFFCIATYLGMEEGKFIYFYTFILSHSWLFFFLHSSHTLKYALLKFQVQREKSIANHMAWHYRRRHHQALPSLIHFFLLGNGLSILITTFCSLQSAAGHLLLGILQNAGCRNFSLWIPLIFLLQCNITDKTDERMQETKKSKDQLRIKRLLGKCVTLQADPLMQQKVDNFPGLFLSLDIKGKLDISLLWQKRRSSIWI